jgi:hypothetical protein
VRASLLQAELQLVCAKLRGGAVRSARMHPSAVATAEGGGVPDQVRWVRCIASNREQRPGTFRRGRRSQFHTTL